MISTKMFVGYFIIVLFTLCNGNNNAMGQIASTSAVDLPTSQGGGQTEQPKGGGQPVQPTENGNCAPSAYLPDPTTGCCGRDRASAKITIGLSEAAAIDQYPWLVIIEYVKDNKMKLLCGGSLISSKYVLTAAHCVVGAVLSAGTPRNVRLGEYDVSNKITENDCMESPGGDTNCNTGAVVIPIEKVIAHPEYNPNPNNQMRRNDIALLRLKSLAPSTDFIIPICIPSTDVTVSPPNESLHIAGWGTMAKQRSSNIKLFVDVPFVSAEQCQPSYNVTGRKVQLWEGQICAGGEKGKNSCKGDSGGPLMYENDKTFEVVGVDSFGPYPCGRDDVPGVYTKVFAYKDWILSQVQGLF